MIINGGSRAAPRDLARHLGREDTNERVRVLELQSPARNTSEAFEDWQTLAEGTKQGELGLYHANIDPEAKYTMTDEQWFRAVDVLEEELRLTGQPRAIVLHEKGGRQHIHVVWQRTDIDTMTLRDDGWNYLSHERASLRLEREFGHDHVPGKHAKRDRENQRDMPDARLDHSEWQQGARGGLDHNGRREQVTALCQAADSGPAFKAALEDAGYVLVRGDKCDFMIMDADAKAYSLVRQISGVNTKELRAFMVEVDPAALPSVAEARAEIRGRTAETQPVEQDAGLSERAEAIRAATLARQAEELRTQEQRQGAAFSALQETQLAQYDAAIDKLAREQARELVAARSHERGYLQNLKEALSPEARAARLEPEAAKVRELEQAQKIQMDAMHSAMQAAHKGELRDLTMQQAAERDGLMTAHEQELARRLEDDTRAMALERELQRRQHEARDREGPERDGRAR